MTVVVLTSLEEDNLDEHEVEHEEVEHEEVEHEAGHEDEQERDSGVCSGRGAAEDDNEGAAAQACSEDAPTKEEVPF